MEIRRSNTNYVYQKEQNSTLENEIENEVELSRKLINRLSEYRKEKLKNQHQSRNTDYR